MLLPDFCRQIWNFYSEHKRQFPWRYSDNPYEIVVSEVMLQQTQTHRVEQKFNQFVKTFPRFHELSAASLHTVLSAWQGLGYNRRGKYLHELAQIVVTQYAGILPNTPKSLVQLPGIGKATAASICAFAFNKPTVFIETNIRTVFIHTFFSGRNQVHDSEIEPLVAATVDHDNPREWYYALMDYGVHLKKQLPNPNRKSRHHTKQSRFAGSDRQIRGAIIRILTQQRNMHQEELYTLISMDHNRIEHILETLIQEKLVKRTHAVINIFE
jgi:A/G-specific adenine glycosylase